MITWSSDIKNKYPFSQYCFDRVSRLWSVLIPALIIGLVLDKLGKFIHPETYSNIFREENLEIKFLISSIFLNEAWFFSIRPGSNAPIWSLSYEFFYYMIFGCIFLISSTRFKILGVFIIILIAGPKVMLLFPCWALGLISYFACKHYMPNLLTSLIILIASGFYLLNTFISRWHEWHPWKYEGLGSAPFYYSAKYYDDFLISLSLATFLYAASRWFSLDQINKPCLGKVIKYFANCSFSLYAIHFPSMAFVAALSASLGFSEVNLIFGILLVLGICIVFARLFEFQLKSHRSFLLKILPALKNKCGIHC